MYMRFEIFKYVTDKKIKFDWTGSWEKPLKNHWRDKNWFSRYVKLLALALCVFFSEQRTLGEPSDQNEESSIL